MPSAILLAHIELWVAELEREVEAFEDAVDEVERVMDEAEDSSERGGEDGQKSEDHSHQRLDDALQKTNRLAELVSATNASLLDAIDAAQQIGLNEQVQDLSEAPEWAARVVDQRRAEGVRSSRKIAAVQRRVVRAKLVASGPAGATGEIAPAIEAQGLAPLLPGAIILQGRYRIAQLLHARPRVNLYLGYRLPAHDGQPGEGASPTLVAIRELELGGLATEVQQIVTQAAFEEFVSPVMFGSPRLPGVGDRVSVERERHYLVMQLRPTRGVRQAVATPLAELLLTHQRWPAWLNMDTALEWGAQLCRIVARLHRMGCVIGDLDPATILVDSAGASNWSPVLLVSWPPALQFWPTGFGRDELARIFPIAPMAKDDVFAAPETLQGRCSEHSDVYALGAILYLLFTRYAPVSPVLRQVSSSKDESNEDGADALDVQEGMSLVPPHLFNNRISSRLEAILFRALALDPADRFPSAFALVEALESIDPLTDFIDPFATQPGTRQAFNVAKVLEWVKRELNE